MASAFVQEAAAAREVTIVHSSNATQASERALWRACVTWGVNPMPNRLVVIDRDGVCVGASYYDDSGFLSALAVLPAYRGKRLGKLLIAATLGAYQRSGVTRSTLHVLGCDASVQRHGLYTSCGYHGGSAERGGTYELAAIPEDVERVIMRATPTPRY